MRTNNGNTIAMLLLTAVGTILAASGCSSPWRQQQAPMASASTRYLTPPAQLAKPIAENTFVDGNPIPMRTTGNTDSLRPVDVLSGDVISPEIRPTEISPVRISPVETRPTQTRPATTDNYVAPQANMPIRNPLRSGSAGANPIRSQRPIQNVQSNSPANQLTQAPLIQRGQYTQGAVNEGMSAWGNYVPNVAAPPVPGPSISPSYGPPSAAAGYVGPGYTTGPVMQAPYSNQPTPASTGFIPSLVNRFGRIFPRTAAPIGPYSPAVAPMRSSLGQTGDLTDIIVNVQETQTGRFQVGAAVNSDAGVTGQITIDERNFDWRRVPESFDDFINGSAFRGGGQGLRIEAMPGSQVQRYMIQFTNPYVFNTPISMSASGFLFDRRFFDWDENRLGGRLNYGYRVTPDLSLSAGLRAERVEISRPRIDGVTALDDVVGKHGLYSGRLQLIQDTRDIAFAPTQGYYFSAAIEQVFGSFDYTRAELDWRRYFLLSERPDGSGRHVLGFSNQLSLSGSDTPIFENFFAGGYSTLRGFDFRGASPQESGVTTGGRLMFLGSVEYLFPLTADDMIKGVAFVDYGTVERDIELNADNYRVAPGLGLRIAIPALGPAPLALDFAVPIARAGTDEIRQFSFYMGVSR